MSPSPDHRDDARPDDVLHERASAELASFALGEPLPDDLALHVRRCPDCGPELDALRATATLGRSLGRELGREPGREPLGADAGGPSPHVWHAIAAELGLDDKRPAATGDSARAVVIDPRPRAHRWWRGAAGWAVAAAVVVGAAAGGWAIGHHGRAGGPTTAGRAALAAQPGVSAAAQGTAVMTTSSNGYQVTLTTHGLPTPSGYYEVWLYNPSANRMVAIGTLGTGAAGTFTVPAGIDTNAYDVIDVSNQRFDGNPAHQRSVLRGQLHAN